MGQKFVKFFVGVLENLKKSKRHSEINWPLTSKENWKFFKFYWPSKNILTFHSIQWPKLMFCEKATKWIRELYASLNCLRWDNLVIFEPSWILYRFYLCGEHWIEQRHIPLDWWWWWTQQKFLANIFFTVRLSTSYFSVHSLSIVSDQW